MAKSKSAEIEITPEMIEAGRDRLESLLEAGVSSAYLVAQVFLAMNAVWQANPRRDSDGNVWLDQPMNITVTETGDGR